jgi:hypothetical protein
MLVEKNSRKRFKRLYCRGDTTTSGDRMAKPNYQYDKRQRELKKVRQQEEKRQKKQARTNQDTNPTETTEQLP